MSAVRWGLPWWIGHGAPTDGVEAARRHGFDLLEISLETPWPETLGAADLREASDEHGVGLGFHAPWRAQTIGHPRGTVARAALDVARECLDFARVAGGEYLVLHAGPRDFGGYPAEGALERSAEHAREGLSRLVDRSQGRIDVLVENTFTTPVGTPDAIEELLGAVPGLGFCFDPGHAALVADRQVPGATTDPDAWFEAAGDRLELVHLMDVRTPDGVEDHLLPGTGNLELAGLVERARKAGCTRCVVEAFVDGEGREVGPKEIRDGLERVGLWPA